MLRDATRHLNSLGLTSIVNATGDLEELKLYAALRDRGELTVRTRTAFGAVAVQHRLTPQFLAELDQARGLYHDDWVAANLVKFFADGGTGLVPPLVYSAQDYETLVMDLDQRGYQIMTHALRADSVHMILGHLPTPGTGARTSRSPAANRTRGPDRCQRHAAVRGT